jgi:hypothetical protein
LGYCKAEPYGMAYSLNVLEDKFSEVTNARLVARAS